MDFFEAQAHAKKRTARLVWLFVFAVLGTIVLAYIATIIGLNGFNIYQSSHQRGHRYNRDDAIYRVSDSGDSLALWRPGILLAVSAGTLLVVGLGSLAKWSEYSSGGSAVAESVGGHRVDPHTTNASERRLLNVVEEMAIASGVPVPAVYLMDDEPAINAFAAGLTTNDAAVCVTRGTMEKLTREELQGVIGHEFSHILNGDMRLNLRIGAIVFGILVISLAGRGILWSLQNVRVSSRDKNSGGIVIAMLFVGGALFAIGGIGYFFGRLIQAAVSRQREFLADASSVQFTRNPGGLTGALKKIGGYALGSSLQTHKAAEIGHFFFADGYGSSLDSALATHPPLEERIRAIDPQFDGKMFVPPEVVDVQHESFVTAGLAAAKPAPRDLTARAAAPLAAIASIGTLTSDQIQNAAALIDSVPAALRTATQSPNTAAVLVCGLLLDDDQAIRARQFDLVTEHAGDDARHVLESLDTPLRSVRPEQKLPLLQLALPAVRQLDNTDLDPVIATLNALIMADGKVSPFEFALEKIFTRSLELGHSPGRATVQYYSFNALVPEISVVLSAIARVSSNIDLDSRAAFAAGAAQIKLIESQLAYLDEAACDLTQLDAALDKLAAASLPIKQRTLVAAAHVVGADGKILIAEAELLRAICATLDVPMPPLAAAA